jgi:dienelactone hydrolase
MRTKTVLLMLLILGARARGDGEADPVFDVKAILAPPLNARTLKKTEKDGIVTEEVMFHSEKDGDKNVDIFAFFSYPKDAKKLPAFIWNQGGLGQATTYWTTFGAKRGYATLCIDFPLPGYRSTGGYPINSGLELGADPKKAPIYHGAVALLRAVSFLEARAEVNKDKIGMCGSSWGGFYTTLMVGIDARLKVGSSMFGSGGLHQGNVWWDGRGWDKKRDDKFRERWKSTLDPAWRLNKTKTPIAWFTGTNDTFYWMPALMESYERAAGPRHLSILPNWNHALTSELDEQVFAWLDVHLKGARAFNRIAQVKEPKAPSLAFAFTEPRPAVRAEITYSHGREGNWSSRCWKTVPIKIIRLMNGSRLEPELPKGPMQIFATVIDKDGFRYSSPMVFVDSAGAKEDRDSDGCQEWGNFEDANVAFLRRHGYAVPGLTKDAKAGAQAAVLKAGKTALGPILYTAGMPQRLTAFCKTEKDIEVSVELAGIFDSEKQGTSKTFKVGAEWTAIAIDFTPPVTLTGQLRADFEVPKGSTLLVDAVRFVPRK